MSREMSARQKYVAAGGKARPRGAAARSVLVEKKMKLFHLVIISAFLATLIIPVANAEIVVQSINFPSVAGSTAPHYGAIRFNIVVMKTTGQNETLTIPVIVNGTTISFIHVNMKATETSKNIAANVTLPNASILITNPFTKPTPIPSNIQYEVRQNPFDNPISSIQYEVKVGDFTENTTLLVYADWSAWAIIIDVVIVAGTFLVLRRVFRA